MNRFRVSSRSSRGRASFCPVTHRAKTKGCQLKTRDPPLGAFGEKARQSWLERFAHGAAEELVALGVAELECLGVNLQQLVQEAQPVERQRRQRSTARQEPGDARSWSQQ